MTVIKIVDMRTRKRGLGKMGRTLGRGEDAVVRVVAYLRVSTGGQERNGLGLTAQEKAVRDYVRRRRWELVGVYKDVVSGAAADEDELKVPRPGLERLLAEAKDRKASLVVVYAADRLYRGDLARVLVQRALRKAGLDVRSVTEPRYSVYRREPTDALISSILDAVAAHERMVITARTRAGRLSKAAQGGFAGGGSAYGYRSERGGKALMVNEDEARIVSRIFRLHRRGLSPYKIADSLNGQGIRSRAGGEWRARQVYRILRRRPFYEGRVYAYAGVKGPAQHRAILEASR